MTTSAPRPASPGAGSIVLPTIERTERVRQVIVSREYAPGVSDQPSDYYRSQRLDDVPGGQRMSSGVHTETKEGFLMKALEVFGQFVVIALIALAAMFMSSILFGWPSDLRTSRSAEVPPPALNALAVPGRATPTGTPYTGSYTAHPGIKYTGNACIRSDGATGREGYSNEKLGCWKY